jgi:hypothetical protein
LQFFSGFHLKKQVSHRFPTTLAKVSPNFFSYLFFSPQRVRPFGRFNYARPPGGEKKIRKENGENRKFKMLFARVMENLWKTLIAKHF